MHVSDIIRRQYYVLYPSRKPHCWFEKMLSKKVDIWVNIHFSKIFDKGGGILTGLRFFIISFLSFLCKGVISANFKEEEKLADLIAPLMLVSKTSTNIMGILVFCGALVLSNLRISFLISPIFTSSKSNILFLLFFRISRMLAWFLYFKMALKTGSSMFTVTESNFGISNFFTIFEKKLFRFSALISIFSFSVRFIFSLERLVREQRCYCFSKFLTIYDIFLIPISLILFFSIFQEGYTFIPLFYIKLVVFFCFLL